MRKKINRAWLREKLKRFPGLQKFLVPDTLDPYAAPVGRPVPGQRIMLDFGPHSPEKVVTTAIGFSWPLLAIQYALDNPYKKAIPRLTGRLKFRPVHQRVIAAQNVAVLKPARDAFNHQLSQELRCPDAVIEDLFERVEGERCYFCSSTRIVRLRRRKAPRICRDCNSDQTPRERWTEGRYVEVCEPKPVVRTDA